MPPATLGQKDIKDISLDSLTRAFASAGNQKAQKMVANPVSDDAPPTTISEKEITPTQTPNLPTPQADVIQESEMQGTQARLEAARQTFETTLQSERTRIQQDLDRLNKQESQIMDNVEANTQPFREKTEEIERERLKVEENFEANQRLTNELEALLTQGNMLINQRRGLPMNQRAQVRSVNQAITEVNARAGVIEAVMAARNNQIAQATNLIDRKLDAMNADRQDTLSYYETLLSLNNQDQLSLSKEMQGIAQEELNLVKSDLENAQKNADYIKELMQNPETAQFMADAGVTLMDSPEQVNKKMAEQSAREKVAEAKNTLTEQGYEFVPFATEDEDVVTFNIGGQDLKFRRPSTELTSEQQGGFTILRDAQGNIVSTRVTSTGSGASSLMSGFSGGSGDPVSEVGYDTQENYEKAVQSILATPGLTKQQRSDVLNMLQSQGLDGAKRWYVGNKFGATEKSEYNQYANGSSILSNVATQLAGTNVQFGPYKNLAETSKPWLAIQRDQEYANLNAQIEFAQAQVRKGFYGTAVTDSEKGTGERFLIAENDDLATIQTKVNSLAALLQFTNDANALRPLGVDVNIEDYLNAAEAVEPPAMETGGEFDVFDSVVGSDEQTPGYWNNLWGNTKSFVGSLFGQ